MPNRGNSRLQRRHGVLFVLPPGLTGEGEKMLLCGCGRVLGPFKAWEQARGCADCEGGYEQDDFLRQILQKER